MTLYALVDGSNVVQRIVNWDGIDTPAQFSPLTPIIVPAGTDPVPGDKLVGSVLTKGVPLDQQNRAAIQAQARLALARLRQIRDTPQITTVNLAAVQGLQSAVQDEARALIGLIRAMLGQYDGTT